MQTSSSEETRSVREHDKLGQSNHSYYVTTVDSSIDNNSDHPQFNTSSHLSQLSSVVLETIASSPAWFTSLQVEPENASSHVDDAAAASLFDNASNATNDGAAAASLPMPRSRWHLALFALLVLINLIVILGNILVILAVYATAKLRNVTNIFTVSLAIADLLLGVFVLPYAVLFEVLDVWIFGDWWCRGWLVADVWISTASILNLCAISVDRYVAVTRPVKYKSIMTARLARGIVAGVWIVSFLICCPPLWPQWEPSSSISGGTLLTTSPPPPNLDISHKRSNPSVQIGATTSKLHAESQNYERLPPTGTPVNLKRNKRKIDLDERDTLQIHVPAERVKNTRAKIRRRTRGNVEHIKISTTTTTTSSSNSILWSDIAAGESQGKTTTISSSAAIESNDEK